MLRYFSCWLIACVLVFASCSSGERTVELTEEPGLMPPVIDASLLPAIPADRLASTEYTDSLLGVDAHDKSANSTPDVLSLELNSTMEEISWGIWQFNAGAKYLVSATVALSVPMGNEVWVAVADFERGAWEIVGPFTEDAHVTLDDARHRSYGSNFYIAVLAAHGNEATVKELFLTTDDGWTLHEGPVAEDTWGIDVAIAEGKPFVVFYDSPELHSMAATDSLGTTWDEPVLVDNDGDVGLSCSLEIVNGNPAVSYYDFDTNGLKYARATDPAGTAWGDPIAVATAGDSGRYCSLVVAAGKPLISYYVSANTYLAYQVALDADGTVWDSAALIDNEGETGKENSMAIIDGRPACTYESDHDVKFAIAGNEFGTSWPSNGKQTIEVGSPGVIGNSLAWISGYPMICYSDVDQYDLTFVHANAADGSVWAAPKIIDNVADAGAFCSLASIDGKPAVAYMDENYADEDSKRLYFIMAVDTFGASWHPPVLVDGEGLTGYYCCLIEANGNALIVYHDYSTQTVMSAVRQAP